MRAQATSRMCFVCGRENPHGLHLHFYEEPERGIVWAEVTLDEAYQGYPGVAHGGILATLLDETAGRALNVGAVEDAFWVTAKLEVRFRHPTPTGVPLRVEGWVVERRTRSAQTRAAVYLPDGTLTAEADAIIVCPRPETLAAWDKARADWRVE